MLLSVAVKKRSHNVAKVPNECDYSKKSLDVRISSCTKEELVDKISGQDANETLKELSPGEGKRELDCHVELNEDEKLTPPLREH